MAQRTFSSPLRISVIAEILLISYCTLVTLSLTAAKSSPSNRIDDGGLTVPDFLPLNSRQVVAIRNRPLTLHCPVIIASDVRVLDLWWLKDGSKLDLDPQQQNPTTTSDHPSASLSRVYLYEDGDLHIEKIIHKVATFRSSFENQNRHNKNYSDEGDYRCVVKSPIGVVFSPIISVSVAALEDKEGEEELKVKAGQPLLLECQITSTPPLTSSHVTWQRGQTNVSRLAQESNRYSILPSGTLAISRVQQSDAGTYRCTGRNDVLKKDRSANVTVVVEVPSEVISSEPPKFLYPSVAGEARENATVILDKDEEHSLDCVASGIPLPSITWVLTYERVNESGVSPFSKILSEGKLFHDTILLSDEDSVQNGNYTCVANNGVGNPITKTIHVSRLPALLKGPNSYKFPPAKTVRFECKVPSRFKLIWYKDGQPLETGRGRVKAKGNEIVISNTIRNDSGFYQCEVIADDHIHSVGTARLFVENNREAPDAPFDLQCVQEFTRTLVISWNVASRDRINAFSIHFMPLGGEELQKVTQSKYTNFTIENLKPYTTYSLYIRSYSAKSASAQSAKVTCTTLEDVPIKAPKTFDVERNGPPTQIRIKWRPLADSEARGKVIFYKLQWRSVGGEFTNLRYIVGDADEFLITDLTPGEPIEVRLLPATSVGWPYDKDNFPWTPINGTDPESNPSIASDLFAPPTMHLMALNSSSILVNWSDLPRPENVSVKGYRLTYSAYAEKVEDIVFYGPFYIYDYSTTNHLFTNLAAPASYEMQLQTFGNGWESRLSTKFIGTYAANNGGVELEISEDFSTAVSGLNVHPISSSELRLTWEVPKPSNPDVSFYYTIKYNRADDNEFYYMSSTSESVDIRNLQPYTSYEFVVQMTTMDGRGGPFSQKIESRTLPGIPGAPVKLHWRVLNQTLVEVEWQPPPSANGVIQKYWVQYKRKNNSITTPGKASITEDTTLSSGIAVLDENWQSRTTENTSLFLEKLLKNEEYLVRVIAETRAGPGDPSDSISVRIFVKKPTITDQQPLPKDGPHPVSGTSESTQSNPQRLVGILIGVGLSLLFITLCTTIIVFRHRCFPILARHPTGGTVQGNGLPPRAKRSVESFNGVEMKILETFTANDGYIDTKGGHPHTNGSIPGPTDPLLRRTIAVSNEGPESIRF